MTFNRVYVEICMWDIGCFDMNYVGCVRITSMLKIYVAKFHVGFILIDLET